MELYRMIYRRESKVAVSSLSSSALKCLLQMKGLLIRIESWPVYPTEQRSMPNLGIWCGGNVLMLIDNSSKKKFIRGRCNSSLHSKSNVSTGMTNLYDISHGVFPWFDVLCIVVHTEWEMNHNVIVASYDWFLCTGHYRVCIVCMSRSISEIYNVFGITKYIPNPFISLFWSFI